MQFCQQCGHELSEDSRFCPKCGAARASVDANVSEGTSTLQSSMHGDGANARSEGPARPLIMGVIVVAIAIAALFAWNEPTGNSEVEHHDAVRNALLSNKAYDSGADFYLFNRCDMFVVVDGKKYTVPGDEQNDECTIANPGDAFRLMAYTRAGSN
jgi:hypothetical protein